MCIHYDVKDTTAKLQLLANKPSSENKHSKDQYIEESPTI